MKARSNGKPLLTTVYMTFLLVLFTVFGVSVCYGEYEVVSYTPDLPVGGAAQQWAGDFTVQWTSPSFADSYTLVTFVYKWNKSATPLSYADLNADEPNTYTPNGGVVDKNAHPYLSVLGGSVIAPDDHDTLRYLHLKTVYTGSSDTPAVYHSDDAVIGPFNIDNAVSGTMRLPDSQNTDQDLQETRQTTVALEVGYPADIEQIFIGETSTLPAEGVPYTTTSYTLKNTALGDKTIYVWFEDQAGNISTTPATADFTLLDPVGIDPNTATIERSVTDTKTFRVSGTAAGYNWTVINEIPETAGENVADFSGSAANTNSVTVTLLNPGTFKLQATPGAGGIALTSGTITVTEVPCVIGDVDNLGSVDITDVLMVIDFIFGKTPTTAEFCAANVDDTNQSIDITDLLKIIDIIFGG